MLTAIGQQKKMSYDQLFNRKDPAQISKNLPVVSGWADDNHYLLMERPENGGKPVVTKVNVKTGKSSPVTQPETVEEEKLDYDALGLENSSNFTLSPDGKWGAYTRENNLYAVELATKKTVQFTQDGSKTILNGYASWVYFEEILGRRSQYKAFWWAPDSRHIVYMRFDDSQVPLFPIYVSQGQHGYLEETHYPKPGDPNPEVKIGITAVDNPKTTWADFNEKTDQYFGTPVFAENGKLWVTWMNRGQDTLKVYDVSLSDGSKKPVYEEAQKAWIDLDETSRFHFLKNDGGVIVKSDKDGWENLYLYDLQGNLKNQITTGQLWGTSIVMVDEKSKKLYLRARRENSARFDLYSVRLDGKQFTRLSFGDYSHDQVSVSPGGKYFISTYSNVATPPKMALVDARGKIIRELGDSKGEEFNDYAIPRTTLLRVKSADGKYDLPMTITYPVDFDSTKTYPVLISIYGGPNAGSVYDRWKPVGGATQWWAQEGLIQVAFDNRSSGHFGKEGLNEIHRQMGKWEIEDYMECGRWLKKQGWVDSSRIAITGGSFGGYMTAMALTYGADVFTHGIANASVTDWRLYDTHYTERFMDTPQENPEGYKNTSVMTYADRYKGLLRIVHGTSDDNVHMQNSIQLIDRLQDLQKHFEFMLYPGERHGIGRNKATKALHNRNEAYEFYYRHLLKKEMPAEFWVMPSMGRR